MKYPFNSTASRCSLGLALALASQVFFPREAHATDAYTLTNGNSTVVIDPYSDWGMSSWVVDCKDQLYRQWSWYRLGSSGRERPIHALSLLGVSQLAANTLNVQYGNMQFRIELAFTLIGGLQGSGSSDFIEQIKVINLTAAALDFH